MGVGQQPWRRAHGHKTKEINGFAHVGVGFCPVLADLIGEPGAELEVTLADDLGRVEE